MEFKYRYGDEEHTVRLEPRPDGAYLAQIGERTHIVEVQRSESGQVTLRIGSERLHAYTAACEICKTGVSLRYVALVDREASVFELERVRDTGRRRGGTAGRGSLEAQMPGQVMEVLVKEGDSVQAGQPLILLEAMKMEIRVSAPDAGIVTRVLVRAGETVERGQRLVDLESDG